LQNPALTEILNRLVDFLICAFIIEIGILRKCFFNRKKNALMLFVVRSAKQPPLFIDVNELI